MGIEVIFEKEQISTLQPTSELFLTIAASIAENDLEVDSSGRNGHSSGALKAAGTPSAAACTAIA